MDHIQGSGCKTKNVTTWAFIWRQTKSEKDRSAFSSQVHTCNRLMSKAKSDYYNKLVSDTKTNPQKLWNSVNRLLHKQKSSPLPDCSDTTTLANSLATFFKDKIEIIRAVFQNGQNGQVSDDNVKPNYTLFFPSVH